MNTTLSLTDLLRLFLLFLAFLSASPGYAADTKITTAGHIGGGFPFFSATTPDGSTTIMNEHHFEADSSIVSPGSLDGQGVADFGELKVRLHVDGPSAEEGTCSVSSADSWTVHHPGLDGVQGVMQLAFDLDGAITVLDLSGNSLTGDDSFARLRFSVAIDDEFVLELNQKLETGLVSHTGVSGSPTVTAPFQFTYGTPFKVEFSLRATGDPDNRYLRTDFNPYFAHYGGGTVREVTVDFMNTVRLTVIAIPGSDVSTELLTESLTDHQLLLSSEIPQGPAPTEPPLTVSREPDGSVRVSWPLLATGWVLDRSLALGSEPSSWTVVPGDEIESDATERFHVVVNPDARGFFRLRLPSPGG